MFTEAIKGKGLAFSSGGATVQVKAAISKVNLARNYWLKKATETIKADSTYTGGVVENKDHTVMAAGAEAFVQGTTETGGRFVSTFSHLELPK